MFLVLFTKQNIGAFYIFSNIVYNIIRGIKEKEIKKYITHCIKQLTILIILTIMAILEMYIKGNLYSFINYTILGIKEFSQSNLFLDVINVVNSILSRISLIIIILVVNKFIKLDKKEENNICMFLIFTVIYFFIQYPIFNRYHRQVSNIIMIITIVYYASIILQNVAKKDVIIKIIKVINTICFVGIILLNILFNYNYVKKMNTTKGPFFGAIISDEQKENIDTICSYIEEKENQGIEVKIISCKAMLYTTPLNINNGELDIPFRGNLGKEGENGLIEKIKELENVEILITKDEEDKLYQESERVRDYIINNLEQVGEIEEFLIYKK